MSPIFNNRAELATLRRFIARFQAPGCVAQSSTLAVRPVPLWLVVASHTRLAALVVGLYFTPLSGG